MELNGFARDCLGLSGANRRSAALLRSPKKVEQGRYDKVGSGMAEGFGGEDAGGYGDDRKAVRVGGGDVGGGIAKDTGGAGGEQGKRGAEDFGAGLVGVAPTADGEVVEDAGVGEFGSADAGEVAGRGGQGGSLGL